MKFMLVCGRGCFCLWLAMLLVVASEVSARAGKAEHVVMVVWDGMRPDFITPQYTPTLYQLALNGVFFKNHHPVYVSSTEVNGTALATGVYPNRSGIIANRDYRPELGWQDSLGTETVEAIRRGDLLTGGHFIAVPSLAEILQQQGYPTIVAGTKPVALLHDRSNRRKSEAAMNSVMLYNGRTIPSTVLPLIVKANEKKEFPTNATPNLARDAWTTKGLTDVLWKDGLPKYTVLWLSDPDASQHAASPGSDTALGGLESSDKNLASVLKALDEKNLRDKTDVIVVSDHGFSTINRVADVAESLRKAKFRAGKKLDDTEPGDIVVVGLGGTVMLYVVDHDEAVTQRLVQFLQGTDYAGVIFSRLPIEGTFPLEQVRLNTTNPAPDVVVALRWSGDKNQYGAPGLVTSDGGTKGAGTHASLSAYDMHNTLVAAGPDFKKGFVDDLPTGNADVVPTILSILNVKPSVRLDGRVLSEALVGQSAPAAKPQQRTLEAKRDLGPRSWYQYLKFTTMGDQIYFDEGNGWPVSK
jgi:predicted AlkP superfamily pyrophosphatase or phosphodiesterase